MREELGDAVGMVLDGGACAVGIESTIIDLSSGRPVLLRLGHITPAAIESVCGVAPAPPTAVARVPPARSRRHYAPLTPMRRVESGRLL